MKGLRVITGTARGTRLAAPEGVDTRPTTDKVKEAIFSAIQFELEGVRFLDLFAGSGQMGIEALSRGAKSCVFVDSSRAAVRVIAENLQKTGLSAQASLLCTDAGQYLTRQTEKFDFIFLDPPYHQGIPQRLFGLLEPMLAKGGVVILETASDETPPEAPEFLHLYRQYRYGHILITIYHKGDGKE